jgi:Domain of unknown function (DUF3786)/Putative Fe-S cluster
MIHSVQASLSRDDARLENYRRSLMARFKNVMEIFTLLDKSNCRKCNEPTCLAFAAAVFKDRKNLCECPHLAPAILATYENEAQASEVEASEAEIVLATLREKIKDMDLAQSADKLGGLHADGKLTLKILGKNFAVDARGNILTDIHINPWIGVPALNYILTGCDAPVMFEWVPFRELQGGKPRNGLFEQMCEKPMKRIADAHPEFFEDLIRLFNGHPVEKHYQSDISLVLYPLPRIPILICYWKPEDGMASDLNLFFDRSAEKRMNIGSMYTLIAGIVRMFEKLFLRHGMGDGFTLSR